MSHFHSVSWGQKFESLGRRHLSGLLRKEDSRVGEQVSKSSAHGKSRDPGILQPDPEGADWLTSLIHKPAITLLLVICDNASSSAGDMNSVMLHGILEPMTKGILPA